MKLKLKIGHDTWNIHLLSSKDYAKKHPDCDSLAKTNIVWREISFNVDEVNEMIVRHELFHANFSYLCLDEQPKLKFIDFEEIMAVFYSKYHKVMEEQTKIVMRVLKK